MEIWDCSGPKTWVLAPVVAQTWAGQLLSRCPSLFIYLSYLDTKWRKKDYPIYLQSVVSLKKDAVKQEYMWLLL